MKDYTNITLMLPGLSTEVLVGMPKKALRRQVTQTNTRQRLFSLFQVEVSDSLPIAAVTAVADGLPQDRYYLRADPMNLAVDLIHIYMIGNGHLQLSIEEVKHFVTCLNQPLQAEGLTLLAPHPTRWYLQLSSPAKIKTHHPVDVLGKAITDYFPVGEERTRWLQHLTEWQMLLHSNEKNIARAAHGKPKVDSLWLWGEGELPVVPTKQAWAKVWSDEPITQGLAMLSGTRHAQFKHDIRTVLSAIEQKGDFLLVSDYFIDAPDDISIGQQWIHALCKQKLNSLTLHLDDGIYQISSRALRPWYQRVLQFRVN